MERYMKSSPYNMIHLCIDEFKDLKMYGRAYNNTLDQPISFKDIHEMVLSIDEIFNKNGNPQSSQEKRSFQKEKQSAPYQPKPKMFCEYEEYLDIQGNVETFDIVIKSRRQSSWQGIVFYKDQQDSFENVLELIKKITTFLSV